MDKNLPVSAVIRSVHKNKYFAVLVINYACFQALEVYDGPDGLAYWEQRLKAADIPYTIDK